MDLTTPWKNPKNVPGASPKPICQDNVNSLNKYYLSIPPTSCTTTATGDQSRTKSNQNYEDWLLDSGANVHVTMHYNILFNNKRINSSVVVGNGEEVPADVCGDVYLLSDTGHWLRLHEVLYVPSFTKNIISMSLLLDKGIKINMTDNKMTLRNGGSQWKLYRDPDIRGTGMFYIKAKPTNPEGHTMKYSTFNVNTNGKQIMLDINTAHDILAHMNERDLRKTCALENIKLTGTLVPCEACFKAKAKAKATRKRTMRTATRPWERFFIDTAGPYAPAINGKRYWIKIIDHFSGFCFDTFTHTKNEMPDAVRLLFNRARGAHIKIDYLRCDNAGEHLTELKILCETHGVQIEYTAPDTPQYNGVVERRFHVDRQRGEAFMYAANFNQTLQDKLWPEAVNTASQMYNWGLTATKDTPPYLKFNRHLPRREIRYRHPFGQLAFITSVTTFHKKFRPRGFKAIFVGYNPFQSSDTYRFYNPLTNRIIETRNVSWLNWKRPDVTEGLQHLLDRNPTPGIQELAPIAQTDEDDENPLPPDNRTHDEAGGIGSGGTTIENPNETETEPTDDQRRHDDLHDDEEEMNEETTNEQNIDATNEPTDEEHQAHNEENNEQYEEQEDNMMTTTSDSDNEGDDQNEQDEARSDEEMRDEQTDESDNEEQTDEDNTSATERASPRARKTDVRANSSKLTRALAKLDTSYNPTRTQQLERTRRSARIQERTERSQRSQRHERHERNERKDNSEEKEENKQSNEVAMSQVTYALASDPGEPKNFKQAMYGNEKNKWQESMKKEIENFLKRKAWKRVDRRTVAEAGRKPVGTRWVYKIKQEQDGSRRYKSRGVVQGYKQIPGVDFTESFSPVATDSSNRIVMGIYLYKQRQGWVLHMYDVEAAFLNAVLNNPMYIEWLPGMVELGFITREEAEKYCCELSLAMYGNVDAAIRWMKTYARYLIDTMKMKQSQTDPCVFYKHDAQGELVLVLAVVVDDTLIAGKKEEVEWAKNEIKKKWNITDLGQVKKHLGIWWEWNKDKNGDYYFTGTMKDMADEIIKLYEKVTNTIVKEAPTPGYPGKTTRKNDGEIKDIDNYRSIVGKVLYYATKIAPEMANAVRDLATHMSNPGTEHWKALGRAIGYLKGQGKDGITLRKPSELRSINFADSDYAKSEIDRKSISGRVNTLGGTITAFSSKKQNTVTLSSTESEYISLTECCQEAMFTNMLLEELLGRKPLPAIIYEDNTGAIFLVKNQQVGTRTKHIDIRHHFIRNLQENKQIEVRFIKSEDNYADIMTKNTTEKIFNHLSSQIKDGTIHEPKGGCQDGSTDEGLSPRIAPKASETSVTQTRS